MIIKQSERDELELALSCIDPEYRFPVKQQHKKTDYTTSGFSRDEIVKLAIEFYRECGQNKNREHFFRKYKTSHAEFTRACRWFELDIKRYYRVDGGKMYRMSWTPKIEIRRRERFRYQWMGQRNIAFTKGYADERELFVQLANTYYGHYYNNPKGFKEILDKVDISRSWYKKKLKRYGIKVEFFMSIDDSPIFSIKSRTPKYD